MSVICHCLAIQKAASFIVVEVDDLEFVRKGVWRLPREHREKQEVQELLDKYEEHAYEDVIKWAEKYGMYIEYDDALEVLVFSGHISPAKNQVAICIILQPSFAPQTRIANDKTPAIDERRRSPPNDSNPSVSVSQNTAKPDLNNRPQQKRRKVGHPHAVGTHGAETDEALDPSLFGCQPQVRIVRSPSDPAFQTGEIIGLDEHDTLSVQKGYIVMLSIRYRVVKSSRVLETVTHDST